MRRETKNKRFMNETYNDEYEKYNKTSVITMIQQISIYFYSIYELQAIIECNNLVK